MSVKIERIARATMIQPPFSKTSTKVNGLLSASCSLPRARLEVVMNKSAMKKRELILSPNIVSIDYQGASAGNLLSLTSCVSELC